MTQSPSSGEKETTPRNLSSRDQRLVEHWRRVLSGFTQKTPQSSPKGFDDVSPQNLPKAVPTCVALQTPLNHELYSAATVTEQMKEHLETPRNEKQHAACVAAINKLFENSPIIKFMNTELKKIGCSPPIFSTPCYERRYGGFHPSMGILICENNIGSVRRLESTLAHEMVHAFDHCRFEVDYNNLRHIACAEVCFTIM
jgi:hypothetical protein